MTLRYLLGLVVLLAAWSYPVGTDSGSAHDWLAERACSETITVNCIEFQANSHVPVFVYTLGPVYNPHFIWWYASLLQDDCPAVDGACELLIENLNWLTANAKSPHKGLSIWPVWGGLANGMVQANIAGLFNEQFLRTGESRWAVLRDRAGVAFDWSWSNGGVAHEYDAYRSWYIAANVGTTTPLYVLNQHNYALLSLRQLCILGGAWCDRYERGLGSLTAIGRRFASIDDFDLGTWSKYRIAPSLPASCHYHNVNVQTTLELGGPVLTHYAQRWALYSC